MLLAPGSSIDVAVGLACLKPHLESRIISMLCVKALKFFSGWQVLDIQQVARLICTAHESVIPDLSMLAQLVVDGLRPSVPPKRLRLASRRRVEGRHRVQPASGEEPPANNPHTKAPQHESGSTSDMNDPLVTAATQVQPAARVSWVTSFPARSCTDHYKPDHQDYLCELPSLIFWCKCPCPSQSRFAPRALS